MWKIFHVSLWHEEETLPPPPYHGNYRQAYEIGSAFSTSSLDSKKWKFIYAMVKNAKRHEAITSCDTISLRLLTPPLLRTQKANEVFLPPLRALIFNFIPRAKFSEKTALLSFGFQKRLQRTFFSELWRSGWCLATWKAKWNGDTGSHSFNHSLAKHINSCSANFGHDAREYEDEFGILFAICTGWWVSEFC